MRYGGAKYHGVEPMTEAFGCVVLLEDHRGFHDSRGEPRHGLNPCQQITAGRRSVVSLRLPGGDEGTSFAGARHRP